MAERNIQPFETRRSLFCLLSLSIFLLIFSCFFLLKSTNPLVPESVLMLMLANNTPVLRTDTKFPQLSAISPLVLNSKKSNPRSRNNQVRTSNSDKQIRVSGPGIKKPCDPNQALIRVFMYDLPPNFHFGLLGWRGKVGKTWPDILNKIPEYPGGLNLQHSIEYWLTLDLLSSNTPGGVCPCTAVRVENSTKADVFFVPFFSSLSYNRHSKLHGREKISKNEVLQDKLVEFLLGRDEWKRYGGKDHLIVAHHPNSMLDARKKLGSAMFLLADFGRFPADVANLEKDIVAPYRHVVSTIVDDSPSFEARPILLYFQGAIYRKDGGVIRQELYYLLKDEKDVHFAFGSIRANGVSSAGQGMASSKFCLNIAGDTPSSNRLFDAIASHCIPVIISDDIELPYEDFLDYSEFCIFVRTRDSMKPGFLLNLLRGISREEWTMMWRRLKQIVHHFEYEYPSQPGDAIQMIWEAVGRKLSSVRLKLHRENRFKRSRITAKSH